MFLKNLEVFLMNLEFFSSSFSKSTAMFSMILSSTALAS